MTTARFTAGELGAGLPPTLAATLRRRAIRLLAPKVEGLPEFVLSAGFRVEGERSLFFVSLTDDREFLLHPRVKWWGQIFWEDRAPVCCGSPVREHQFFRWRCLNCGEDHPPRPESYHQSSWSSPYLNRKALSGWLAQRLGDEEPLTVALAAQDLTELFASARPLTLEAAALTERHASAQRLPAERNRRRRPAYR